MGKEIIVFAGLVSVVMVMLSVVAAVELHVKMEASEKVSTPQLAVVILSVMTWSSAIIFLIWSTSA